MEKIKESLSSVLPITAIVLLLCVSIAPLTPGAMVLFLFGALLLILGTGVFTLGVDMSMIPMGDGIGVQVSRARRILLPLVICFVPRILVGVVPYFVHRGIMKLAKEKKGAQYIALPAAGVAGALVNTLLVMNLIYFCFSRTLAAAKNIAVSAVYDVILGIIAANGIPEAIAAALLTLAVGRALLKFMAR